MSSRMFQGVLLQLSEAAQTTIGVIDAEGNVISCSDTTLIGEKWPDAATAVAAMLENPVREEPYTFYALKGWNPAYGYSAFVLGTDAQAEMLVRMTQVSLNSAKAYYEEKHDKGTFVKNIITDNILPGDIYIRAKELHFPTELPRAVYLVRQVGRSDVAVVELLQSMYPDTQQDFVINVNETDIALVRQVPADTTGEELTRVGRTIEERLKSELFVRTTIGIGTISEHLRELADSYKEAQVAIEVGKVFDTEKTVEFIKNYLPQELKEKFEDDELYYFLDLIDEYYSESGILDAQPDNDGYVNIDLEEVVAYIVKEAKKDEMGEYDPEEILFVVQGEMEYGNSLGQVD